MENPYEDHWAATRAAWNEYDPGQHLPPFLDRSWPQLGPPIKRSELDPTALYILNAYAPDRPIPPRIEALATMPAPEWMLSLGRYQRQIRKALMPWLGKPAERVRDT